MREGDRINNYLLEAKIGSGSFGEVWRARHHVFGDYVAIKIPTDTQFVRNLQREGIAVHGLRHPNIVRVIDLDPYADPPYLVMELVNGPSLRSAIEFHKTEMPIAAAVTIMRGMLSALDAAHAGGLFHRDIKPANILLDHQPMQTLGSIAEQSIKVTDFGLGQFSGLTSQTMMQSGSLRGDESGRISGTLAYMSPEQREGRSVDARSDLYSCGIVLFEMLTGELPQGIDLPSRIRPSVPKGLDQVFAGSYARLDQRFPTAKAMNSVLAAFGQRPSAVPYRPRGCEWNDRRDAASKTCQQCGGRVHDNDQFCIHCGGQTALSVPRCPSCQGYVQRSDRYCIFCGKDLRVLVT